MNENATPSHGTRIKTIKVPFILLLLNSFRFLALLSPQQQRRKHLAIQVQESGLKCGIKTIRLTSY